MNTWLTRMEISRMHEFSYNIFKREGRSESLFTYSHQVHHDTNKFIDTSWTIEIQKI